LSKSFATLNSLATGVPICATSIENDPFFVDKPPAEKPALDKKPITIPKIASKPEKRT